MLEDGHMVFDYFSPFQWLGICVVFFSCSWLDKARLCLDIFKYYAPLTLPKIFDEYEFRIHCFLALIQTEFVGGRLFCKKECAGIETDC